MEAARKRAEKGKKGRRWRERRKDVAAANRATTPQIRASVFHVRNNDDDDVFPRPGGGGGGGEGRRGRKTERKDENDEEEKE